MDLEAYSVEQLNALADDLDQQRRDILARAREVAAVRARRLVEENAALHGLTVEQYAATKQQAVEEGVPLQSLLGPARVRAVQVARATVASVGAKGKRI